VFEAVCGDQFSPVAPAGPDPTGILPLRQCWDMVKPGGHIVTHGIGQRGQVSFPAAAFCISGKTFPASGGRGVRWRVRLAYEADVELTVVFRFRAPLQLTL
jgi:hypothetical protein